MSDAPRPRFVVGTGRCGSTLLSRMLSQNARLLSVFEFFSGIDQFFRFQPEPVEGAELARRLRQDHPMLTMVLARGYEVPEVVYPFGEPGTRFALGDPVPWILGIALARVSDDPDALFDALMLMLIFMLMLFLMLMLGGVFVLFAWLGGAFGTSPIFG